MRESSKSRVAVKDLNLHDTVYLSGHEVGRNDGIFSLHFMGESDTITGEVLEITESPKQGKIRIRVEAVKFAYLLDVDPTDEFLKIEPKLKEASKLNLNDRIILRNEASPESLEGKAIHTELVNSFSAIAQVRKVKTLKDGCKRITVMIANRKRFTFIVEPSRTFETI